MKKGDIIIGIIIIVIMVILGLGYKLYISSIGDELYVNIYIDQQLVESVRLTETIDKKIVIDNEYGYNLIHIHDNGVEVLEADCPSKDDVRQGFVSMPGIPIICVPHHLRIIIEGGEPIYDDVT